MSMTTKKFILDFFFVGVCVYVLKFLQNIGNNFFYFFLESIVDHTVAGIGLDIVFQKCFTGYNTGLRMMTGTMMALGTLTQGIDVDLVNEFLTFSYCK